MLFDYGSVTSTPKCLNHNNNENNNSSDDNNDNIGFIFFMNMFVKTVYMSLETDVSSSQAFIFSYQDNFFEITWKVDSVVGKTYSFVLLVVQLNFSCINTFILIFQVKNSLLDCHHGPIRLEHVLWLLPFQSSLALQLR